MQFVTSVISGVFGLIFMIVELVLVVYAIMDIFKSSMSTNAKLLWLIVILLIPILGSLLYIFWGRSKKFVD